MAKNTKAKHALPPPVTERLKVLGQNIKIARTRRGFSQEHLAELVLVNRNTIRRLEQGDPGVSLAVFVSALWVLQLDADLERLAHPDLDKLGLSLVQASAPQRIHMKTEGDENDF